MAAVVVLGIDSHDPGLHPNKLFASPRLAASRPEECSGSEQQPKSVAIVPRRSGGKEGARINAAHLVKASVLKFPLVCSGNTVTVVVKMVLLLISVLLPYLSPFLFLALATRNERCSLEAKSFWLS